VQFAGRLTEPPQERLIARERGQLGLRDLAEQGRRVMPGRLPAGRIDRGEQLAGLGMPGPAKVQHELTQWAERLGQRSAHGEAADGSHGE
jgi:hypothetical protein